jgi:hypothetical protein
MELPRDAATAAAFASYGLTHTLAQLYTLETLLIQSLTRLQNLQSHTSTADITLGAELQGKRSVLDDLVRALRVVLSNQAQVPICTFLFLS